MIHDLTMRLIDRIHAQTEAGGVQWTEGPGRNAFAFEIDDFQVAVEATPSTVGLIIADAEGRELETLSEDELAGVSNAKGQDYETIVRAIHARARRSALGTDDAIERILRAMD